MASGIHHLSSQEGLNLELGQGGYEYSAQATVAGFGNDTYIAVTALVADDGSHCTVVLADIDTGEQVNHSIPVGSTVYGRWSSVILSANEECIIYKGN